MYTPPKHLRCIRKGLIGLIVILLLAILLLATGVFSKFFQRFDYDEKWCREQIVGVKPLLAALESYKQKHAKYPDALDNLIPVFIKEVPVVSPSEGRSWWYNRNSDNSFDFFLTTNHFASSHDILIFRSTKEYPAEWKKNFVVYELDDWRFIIGGSNLNLKYSR